MIDTIVNFENRMSLTLGMHAVIPNPPERRINGFPLISDGFAINVIQQSLNMRGSSSRESY